MSPPAPIRTAVYFAWVLAMAACFANAEIQIEGVAGWAAALPTWRIEHHWLLDIFWGGRAMTGYHAWVFPFMALAFFAPLAFHGRWRGADALLALAGLTVFWIAEDFLWFLLNPAFGWSRFDPAHATWHRHWLLGAPIEYWAGLAGALAIVVARHRPPAAQRGVTTHGAALEAPRR